MRRTERAALKRATEIAGGQSALARACNVTQPYIHYWLTNAKGAFPAHLCLLVESATGVSRYDLGFPQIRAKSMFHVKH
jgi:DNA-binding transcriptional regulator YdaS (Cro superfamily)